MNSAEKMQSKNGKLILIINKYKFSFYKFLQNGLQQYKCTKRGYTANLKISYYDIVWVSCNIQLTMMLTKENRTSNNKQ